MSENIPEKIKSYCELCGVGNIEKFIEDCSLLKKILTSENKKYNLTRIREDSDYWNKHIADSLSVVSAFPELKENNYKIADVGCGAGFPSLVLAIAFKNLKLTAIDSIQKKTNFVQLAAKQLELNNLDVIWGRARELKINEQFDYVTARAVAEPIKIFKECRKFINQNGKIIIFQTPKTQTAPVDILNKWTKKYSFTWDKTDELILPGGDKRLFIYAVQNSKNTASIN